MDYQITPGKAAQLLNVNRRTIQRWCDEELLGHERNENGWIKIWVSELGNFARANGIKIDSNGELGDASSEL